MIAPQPRMQHLQKYTVREIKVGGQWRRFIPCKYSDRYLKPGHKHLPFFLYAHEHAERCFYNAQIINTRLEPHAKGISFKIMFSLVFREHLGLAAPSKIMLLCSLVKHFSWSHRGWKSWKIANQNPSAVGWKTAFKQGNSLSRLSKPTFLDLRCGWCVSIRFSSASSLLLLKHSQTHAHTLFPDNSDATEVSWQKAELIRRWRRAPLGRCVPTRCRIQLFIARCLCHRCTVWDCVPWRLNTNYCQRISMSYCKCRLHYLLSCVMPNIPWISITAMLMWAFFPRSSVQSCTRGLTDLMILLHLNESGSLVTGSGSTGLNIQAHAEWKEQGLLNVTESWTTFESVALICWLGSFKQTEQVSLSP